jgi:hypothetical protein
METPVPIFQLFTTTETIKIYANGVVEGCHNLIGISNFIPLFLPPDVFQRFSKPWHEGESPTAKPNMGKCGDGGSDSVAPKPSSSSEQCSAATGEK